MKILVTALKDDVNEKMDPRFGRARYWYVYDTEKNEECFIDNSKNISLDHGAGIQAATSIVDEGIDI
ncbi:NifB/NifX family molybdenum-iron cluster-binding protein, partial [Deferribacter abyssi]|uniref:NifB/NifX family molybdenum-iron cluster-binding protein n=1 Tax=Deferribacter abyssi TaxID=213806 RepID=UPI003C2A2F0A